MDLKKFDEVLNKAINEEQVANLDNIIVNELENWTPEILESVADYIYKNEKDIAEQAGYKCYGGDGFRNNALVLDVKGRPEIDPEKVGKENDENFWEEIDLAIATFADVLNNEFEGFTIRGRSGGYWGLEDLDHNIQITEHGYDLMKAKTLELLEDPELSYKEAMEEATNEADIKGVVYDVMNYDLVSVSNALITGDDTIEIKPEFLERMNELSELIDKQEEEMQKPEFWQSEE